VLGEIRALPVDDPVRQGVQRAVDGLLKDAQRSGALIVAGRRRPLIGPSSPMRSPVR
jgi:hypothetical protein